MTKPGQFDPNKDAALPADASGATPLATPSRKPRLMVAGEFSAGKTQLINGLLGEVILPSNVTATALPPVWLVEGEPALSSVDVDGQTLPIDSLEKVDMERTKFCLLSHPSPFLQSFDIIDTPGNSDPNIPAEKWEAMLGYADLVIWCTNATQAWRQSEKAVWNDMPERLLNHATIVVTHADRIIDERSVQRVERRVRRETEGYFQHVLMASLLKSEDVARISDHLVALLPELDTLQGMDCQAASDFAKAHFVARVAMPAVTPEEPVVAEPAAEVAFPDVEVAADQTDWTEVAPSDAEVLAQVMAAASKPDLSPVEDRTLSPNVHVLVPTTVGVGHARVLWNTLSRDLDMTDPAAILACVERLLDALQPSSRRSDPTTISEINEFDPRGLVESQVGRRLP